MEAQLISKTLVSCNLKKTEPFCERAWDGKPHSEPGLEGQHFYGKAGRGQRVLGWAPSPGWASPPSTDWVSGAVITAAPGSSCSGSEALCGRERAQVVTAGISV